MYQKIRDLRKKLKLSQAEFAKKIVTSQPKVSLLENGLARLDAVTLKRIIKLAEKHKIKIKFI